MQNWILHIAGLEPFSFIEKRRWPNKVRPPSFLVEHRGFRTAPSHGATAKEVGFANFFHRFSPPDTSSKKKRP
jgi:hypothetical protein